MEYPILEHDSTPTAFIEPGKIIKPRDVPEHCVISFFKEVIDKVVDEQNAHIAVNNRWEDGPHPLYEITHRDRRLAFFHPGVGAPLAAGLLEEVIAYGCRKFMVCGGCGVLERDIAVGHVIVVSSAVRDEGVSYHYIEPGREITANDRARNALPARSAIAASHTGSEKHGPLMHLIVKHLLRLPGGGQNWYSNAATQWSADYVVSSDVVFSVNNNSGNRLYLYARIQVSNQTYYRAEIQGTTSNNVLITRSVAGTPTTLATCTFAIVAGTSYRFNFSVQGTSLTVDQGGSQVCPATDSQIGGNNVSAGIGMRAAALASITTDNFVAGDGRFVAVYHMNQDPSTSVLDSSGNARHLSSEATLTAANLVGGQIGYGISFTDDDVDHLVSPTPGTAGIQSFTMEAWGYSANWAAGTWRAFMDVYAYR